jgi:hypothetical protein
MIATTRAALTAVPAVLVTSILGACALAPALAGAAEGSGEGAVEPTTVSYKKESYAEYQQQLAARQIKSVTINKRLRSLRVTLKDGTHVLAKYGRKEEPKVASALAAKHVSVTILKPVQATKEASATPHKHKLRYIAGGILVVAIVVVAGVLLFDRGRKRRME